MKTYRALVIGLLSIWGAFATTGGILVALGLLAFHQIKFIGLNTTPRLPYAWALAFEMLPNTWIIKKYGEWGGFAIGNVNLFQPEKVKKRPSIKLHELYHSWQNMQGGILKSLVYNYYSVVRRLWMNPKKAYITNPLEKTAYIFSGEEERYQELLKKWT